MNVDVNCQYTNEELAYSMIAATVSLLVLGNLVFVSDEPMDLSFYFEIQLTLSLLENCLDNK